MFESDDDFGRGFTERLPEKHSQPLRITILESTGRDGLEIPVPVQVLSRLLRPPSVGFRSNTLLPLFLVLLEACKVRFGILATLKTFGRRVFGNRVFVLSILGVSWVGLLFCWFSVFVGHDARKGGIGRGIDKSRRCRNSTKLARTTTSVYMNRSGMPVACICHLRASAGHAAPIAVS